MLRHVAVATLVGLAGCQAAQIRHPQAEFKIVSESRVEAVKVGLVADCIADDFKTFKWSRRVDRTRIDLADNAVQITLSADIFDSGRVVLYESPNLFLIPLDAHKAAFERCVKSPPP